MEKFFKNCQWPIRLVISVPKIVLNGQLLGSQAQLVEDVVTGVF